MMNSSTYQVFRDASQIVRTKWLKGGFIDGEGNQCLVQSVMTSAGEVGRQLPADFLELIDKRLMSYPDYKAFRIFAEFEGSSIQECIMAWNDVSWRRRGAVVKVLSSIADSLAEQEIARLSAEIVELKSKQEQLQYRIAELEAENATLWRRITNHFTLEREKSELQALSDHLDQKWDEFSSIKV